MRSSMLKALFLLLVSFAVLPGCIPKRHEWHQKLSLIVETPNGRQIEASSVSKVTLVDSRSRLNVPEARGVRFELYGEAVALEITPGRYIFMLLGGVEDLAQSQLPLEYNTRDLDGWVDDVKAQDGRVVSVADWSPQFVTFDDISDPSTVQSIDPDNLNVWFGEGHAITSIEFRITSEPVTDGVILDLFDWWPEYENKQLDGDRYRRHDAQLPLANSLNRLSFKKVR